MELQEFDSRKSRPSFRSHRKRTILLFIFLELCFAFLIYRLFYIQCVKGGELKALAKIKHQKAVSLRARRGGIFDRNLQPLAINMKAYSLYADPAILDNPEVMAKSLSSVLNMPEKTLIQKLGLDRRFVWLERQLPDSIVEQVKSFKFRGLDFEEEEKRFYPKGSLASHVMGFVGLDNVGLEGIEKQYDEYIRGKLGEFESPMDRMGRELRPKDVDYDKPTRGYDMVLTIDEVIQHIAEKELETACRKWEAVGGTAIIMNPKTGEILALANYPNYNLNRAFSTSSDLRRNKALIDLYEPGSAFKIVTASALINEGLVTKDELIDCENGVCDFNGYVVHDVGRYGLLTFSQVIEKSSNVGIVKFARRLGEERLYDYIKAFGFNDKTGVDISEVSGFVRPLEKWTRHSMIAIPFGQEISVTALHMLCAANAIAHNGVIMQPFLVRSIKEGQKPIKEFTPKVSRSPISIKTAGIMRDILTGVVKNGTGKNAQVNGYKVAGKTGTSQKADRRGKGYISGKYVSSFVGFVPADDPLISVIVIIDEPKVIHTGGTVACPVFKEIATQVMQYMVVGQGFHAEEADPAS